MRVLRIDHLIDQREFRFGISPQHDRDLSVTLAINSRLDARCRKSQDRGDIVTGDPGLLSAVSGINRLEHKFLLSPVDARGDNVVRRRRKPRHRLVREIAQNHRIWPREPHLDRVTATGAKGQTLCAKFALRQTFGRERLKLCNQWRNLINAVGSNDDMAIARVRVFGLIGQHEPIRTAPHKGRSRHHVVLPGKPLFEHHQVSRGLVDRRPLLQLVVDKKQRGVAIGEELLLDLTKQHEADDGNPDQTDNNQPPSPQRAFQDCPVETEHQTTVGIVIARGAALEKVVPEQWRGRQCQHP